VEWLQQEVFHDPPQGQRQKLDLVGKLRTNWPLSPRDSAIEAETWLALIHVEIEHRDTVVPLRGGILDYYKQLRKVSGPFWFSAQRL
jgi:hypothetical protein